MSGSTVAAVLGLCAAPRLIVLALTHPPELTFYWYLSTTLLLHGTFGPPGAPDTSIEPLYPAFLAAARWMTGDRLALVLALQVAVAAAGGVLLYALTTSLTGDRRAAWIATMLYAFDPYLAWQSSGLMETPVLTAGLVAVAWSARVPHLKGAIAAGALTGLVVLTRFSLLPLIVLVPAVLWRRSTKHAAAALACSLLAIAPWSARGYLVDGSVVPSRVGLNLAVSLSDAAEQLLPIHNNDLLASRLEDKTDPELLAAAVAWARERPSRALKMKLRNLAHVFNPRLLPYAREPDTAFLREQDGTFIVVGAIPRPRVHQWIHGTWRAALLVFAVMGAFRRGFRWDDGVLWAVIATITMVCTVFYPTTRLTTPMVFAWMVFAAYFASLRMPRIGISFGGRGPCRTAPATGT